jgi:hypothetical protein
MYDFVILILVVTAFEWGPVIIFATLRILGLTK